MSPLLRSCRLKPMSNSNPGSSSPLLSNRYQILKVLGDGGFGRTYLVEDTQMPSRRKCVLKQLKPTDDDPQILQIVRERFQREAAVLEQLGEHHRQIPRLYAYFSEGDEYYLVEEWIDGETLAQKVQRQGILSEAEVRSLLVDLLPTLSDIHQQGIVHRDIKPDNIILRHSDQKPVLIDFGAVKEVMSTILNSQGKSTHSIVIGTPGYMPSEQLAGRPVFSSDLYSLGFTAIYLLTGRHPQEFESDPQTGQILWRQYASNISPGFAAILDRAIQTYAHYRFATAPDMASVLASGADTMPPPTRVSSSSDGEATIAIASASSTVNSVSHSSAHPPAAWTWQWALIGMGVASLVGASGVLAYRMLHPSASPSASISSSG